MAGIHTIFREPFRPVRGSSLKDESIGSFISRRWDERLVQRLASAVFHGIYAGDVWKLSARSLLSQLWHLEVRGNGVLDAHMQTYRNGKAHWLCPPYYVEAMEAKDEEIKLDHVLERLLSRCSVFTFKNGTQQLTDALHKNLVRNPRVRMKLGTRVESYEMATNGVQKVKVVAQVRLLI